MKEIKGFRMTETDIEIIKMISESGVQSYENLKATVLKDYSKSQSWKIPKRLVKQGWLLESYGDRSTFLGWRLNTRDYKTRNWISQMLGTHVKRAPIYRTNFDHDQMLDRIIRSLRKAKVVEGFTPEHVLRRETAQRYWYMSDLEKRDRAIAVPDAILDLNIKGRSIKVALELEASRKSKKRIYDKLEHYLIHPELPFTFYVIKGKQLLEDFQSTYRLVLEKSLRVKLGPKMNGIYFSELQNILDNGPDAKFQGLDNDISLNSL
jgi:hypothetical protein